MYDLDKMDKRKKIIHFKTVSFIEKWKINSMLFKEVTGTLILTMIVAMPNNLSVFT